MRVSASEGLVYPALMPAFICTACGMQYAESDEAPAQCIICEEERQYVPPRGQTWTTLQVLQQSHTNTFREYEKGIIGIGSVVHQSPAYVQDHWSMPVHQGGKRRLFPALEKTLQ